MKLERINDNQIRCTLTVQDLADRHLQLSELAYGNDKTKRLFRDLMQQASCELGFHTEDIPLLIEAVPMPGDLLILTVTKVEYPEELDTRFSNFSDYGDYPENMDDDDDSPTLEGADTIRDLFQRISAAAAALHNADSDTHAAADSDPLAPFHATAENIPHAGTDDTSEAQILANSIKLFSFHEIDHIIRLAHVLKGFYHGYNSLFLDPAEHVYYLLLGRGGHTPGDFNKVCNILSEYALQNRYVESAEAYFEEHFQCIAARNALQRLAKL